MAEKGAEEGEVLIFSPSEEFRKSAHIKSEEEYKRMYRRSLEDVEGFWSEAAENLHWFRKWDKVFEWDKEKGQIKWFVGGKLNVSYNCLDRHITTWRKNKAALIWVGNEPGEEKIYTYQQLYREVNRFANVLKKLGIKKGDRIAIYLPMIPELPIAMLAAVRIGAIHSVVFGGFSAESLRDRINDCKAKLLITCDGTHRGKKEVPMKSVADEALTEAPSVEKVVVVNRAGYDVEMKEGRDLWWHELMEDEEIEDYCPPEEMDAEDPLFILYTSGSTGKPKGVLHTHGGYLTYVHLTTRLVFDLRDEDTYWCTADIGWITGHSYIVYGPLSNGATSVMFEGVPNYPHPDRFWEVVDRYSVNIFYTAPTAIRALMREGDEWVKKHDLSSLRLLGTVGEPINPEAWLWYYKLVGKERCPIVDTWWQTETGGILITPLPGVHALKPGSAVAPFFGVEPAILREDGSEAEPEESGYLVIKRPWPSIARTIWGDHERYMETYWRKYPGMYFTGDGAKKDSDGYIWITGRVDDVINVSGHRLGTAEIESALVAHPAVAEAAVVGFPHELKGQGIYAYVLLKVGYEPSEELRKELRQWVRKEIGPIATPDHIHFAENLPKTRSGKIMRRILRKIAAGDFSDFGDTSTLADPMVLEKLIEGRKRLS
ncbi:MAG: acetate--CoA ligase [Thermoplasmata archaeon]|nr:MAG: acetate--CoA ligase [Thermoplasmata archaeon]RLF75415.1 MAG: acetate--CoA ligase [Thermoplasmata archaeon]HDD60118.1 acetate--CoA ligase [Euryarchaeota archaeon]